MILSKQDMRFYIREDKKRNLGNIKWYILWFKKIYKNDGYMSYHYLKNLRHLEYYQNIPEKCFYNKLLYIYYRWKHHRLSIKYNLSIGPNMVGYGFFMPHIIGGVLLSIVRKWVIIVGQIQMC